MAWSNILGHNHWIDAFRAVERRGRMAHAYLFVGPDGIGKRLFGRELAKAKLCENPPAEPPLTACGECASCHLVDAGTHPDFFQVRKGDDENELRIDVLRELHERLTMKSARGHGKVAILDDVDDLNEEAANSFLKSLEEPPPGSLFILVGTSLERQLPTIRSRCQAVRFAPLSPTLVKQILEHDDSLDRTLLPRLVRLAEGSPGQGRMLSDPDLWTFRDPLLAALARRPFNSLPLGKEFIKFVEEAGKEAPLQRTRARLTMKLILAAIRDAVRVRLGEAPSEAVGNEAQLLQALSARAEPEKWAAVVDRFLEAEVHLDRYLQVGLVVEALMDATGQLLDRA